MMDWRDVQVREGFDMRVGVVSEGVDNAMLTTVLRSAFNGMGLKTEIVEIEPNATEFDEAINHLRECGFKAAAVGNPHKMLAARIGEKFYMAQESVGVANALLFANSIYAQNSEVPGFMETIAQMEPAKALVMGTGQGARSVCMALYRGGWKIRAWSRNAMKTRVLQTTFKRHGDIELATSADPSGCALIVNATPIGAKPGEQPPLEWNHVRPKTVVYDLVVRRVPTELLRAASLRGLKTIDGRDLLVAQAALALEWWTDKKAPREAMRESLRGR